MNKNRSGGKGGRMVRKASKRVVRSKTTQLQSSALPSVAKIQRKESQAYILVMIDGVLTTYTIWGVQGLHAALRDALHFYDRVAGPPPLKNGAMADQFAEVRGRSEGGTSAVAPEVRSEGGWTAADVRRLEEIRKLVAK